MKTVSFFTFGCRTNQCETEEMMARFQAAGWKCVPFGEKSDFVVVQTCTVTARSDAKVRQMLRRIAQEQPTAGIVVAGCGVERHGNELRAYPGVYLVVGNKDKDKIPEMLIREVSTTTVPAPVTGESAAYRTRPAIKIQEGCDSFCSYCIVPFVRGAPRSIPLETIREKAAGLIRAGAKEIVLTGTHLGLYADGDRGLEHVVKEASKMPGDFRVRISSLEPMGINPALIEMVCSSIKICPHLHISFQSLCDPVLAAMGRPYSVRNARDLIGKIHSANPNVRIGCDLIVGFPGESAEMFEETCAQIKELPLHYGHVFRYSPRPGTKAAQLSGRISSAESTERSKRLRSLLAANHAAFVESQLGTTQTVLLEDENERSGFTGNYLRVHVNEAANLEGNSFVRVKLKEFSSRKITGEKE